MTKTKWLLLPAILALAAFLRFWQLGVVPPGLDWDEASIGYNAYSLLKTGSDEYGNVFPASIRSFGDFKPSAYVYLTIPSVAVFGLTEFAVRFPSALAGTLTVLVTFFLVRNLNTLRVTNMTNESNLSNVTNLLSLCATALLAISPWHIQFSRLAFEANLALFFTICGGYFLAKFISRQNWTFFTLAVFGFVSALYSYHSARLMVPLLALGIGLYHHRIFFTKLKTTLLNLTFAAVLLLPLAMAILQTSNLQARFGEVSIFASAGLKDVAKVTMDTQKEFWQDDLVRGEIFKSFHSRYVSYARLLAKNYLDHFNFNFLFVTADGNGRHHAPDMGLLYLVEVPFLLVGAYQLIRKRPRFFFFLFWWLLLAPLPATLTADTPHAVRSLSFLPTFQIITALGLLHLISQMRQMRQISLIRLASLSVGFLFSLNVFYFLHQYFVHLPIEFASSFQYGYKEMVTKVSSLAADYDEVYVTTKYDQPYIYFLFYGKVDPHLKNDGTWNKAFGKYRFVNWGEIPNEQKSQLRDGILAVHAEDDFFSPRFVLDSVSYPEGKTAFVISHM